MTSKRLNFDVTPEQEAQLGRLREVMGAGTTKDTVLRAVQIVRVLSEATRDGGQIFVRTRDGELQRVVVPELEPIASEYEYLVVRPHAWRRQPWIKGSRVLAATLWRDMLTNEQTVEEAAESWQLPEAAIREAVAWCESHRDLLELEAREEAHRLADLGADRGAASAG